MLLAIAWSIQVIVPSATTSFKMTDSNQKIYGSDPDVVVDIKRHAVGFALKNSKNDKFHTNADDPTDDMHRDWIWCAGCKESPLDIGAIQHRLIHSDSLVMV